MAFAILLFSSLGTLTWYLDSTLVPLALLDDEVPDEEKRRIADAILGIKMPYEDENLYQPEDKPDTIISNLLQIDKINKGEQLSLVPLINNFTFYIFSPLEFQEERIRDWLVLPPKFWTSQSYYQKFKA